MAAIEWPGASSLPPWPDYRRAPVLLRDGLFHVGVDFVGSKILELNVFSPGGLHPCERAYGLPFGKAVIERLERRLAAS